MPEKRILITENHLRRLQALLQSARRLLPAGRPHLHQLQEDLENAVVMSADSIPPQVVTIDRQVHIRDLEAGYHSQFRLVFPRDADIRENRISVLSPIGASLIGAQAGDVVEVSAPRGTKWLRVLNVLQPRPVSGQAA